MRELKKLNTWFYGAYEDAVEITRERFRLLPLVFNWVALLALILKFIQITIVLLIVYTFLLFTSPIILIGVLSRKLLL